MIGCSKIGHSPTSWQMSVGQILALLEIPRKRLFLPLVLALAAASCEGILFAILIPILETTIQSVSRLVYPQEGLTTATSLTSSLLLLVLLLVGLSSCKILLQYCSALSLLAVIRTGAHNLREKLFAGYLNASKMFFDQTNSGLLYQIVIGYTQEISLVLNSLHQGFFKCAMIGSYLLVLFYSSWQLALIILLIFPLLYLLVNRLIGKIKVISHRYAQHLEKLSSTVADLLRNMLLVKTTGTEAQQRLLFSGLSNELRRLQFGMDTWRCLLPLVQEALVIIIVGVVILAAYYLLSFHNARQVASIAVFFIVSRRILGNIGFIGEVRGSVAQVSGLITQIENMLTLTKTYATCRGGKEFSSIEKEICFSAVSFAYPNQSAVLAEFSAVIPRGKISVLVGPSGTGKTTLIQLLLRLYSPSVGLILVDDVPINEFSLDSWYGRVALVTQDVLLFNDTLRMNLCYGLTTSVSDDRLLQITSAVGLDYLFANKEKSLDTLIGEAGTKLSGGEKQRLSLARALLRQSALFIFDEPTSHLSTKEADAICQLISSTLRGQTVVIASHDPTLLKYANLTIDLSAHPPKI